jgi:hypothetical protein
MRVKAVSINDYRSDKGLQLDVSKTAVWQFLVSNQASIFMDWFKHLEEQVKRVVERKVGLFSLPTSVVEEEKPEFAINSSVLGYGVSLEELRTSSLKEFFVPIFVACDLKGLSLEQVQSWVLSQEFIPEFYYILDLSLTYTEVHYLTEFLKQKGFSENIRLIGDCVFKLKGQNYCGIFSPSFVKAHKLEWIYDSHVHKATQVKLCENACKVLPIEQCNYPTVR